MHFSGHKVPPAHLLITLLTLPNSDSACRLPGSSFIVHPLKSAPALMITSDNKLYFEFCFLPLFLNLHLGSVKYEGRKKRADKAFENLVYLFRYLSCIMSGHNCLLCLWTTQVLHTRWCHSNTHTHWQCLIRSIHSLKFSFLFCWHKLKKKADRSQLIYNENTLFHHVVSISSLKINRPVKRKQYRFKLIFLAVHTFRLNQHRYWLIEWLFDQESFL